MVRTWVKKKMMDVSHGFARFARGLKATEKQIERKRKERERAPDRRMYRRNRYNWGTYQRRKYRQS